MFKKARSSTHEHATNSATSASGNRVVDRSVVLAAAFVVSAITSGAYSTSTDVPQYRLVILDDVRLAFSGTNLPYQATALNNLNQVVGFSPPDFEVPMKRGTRPFLWAPVADPQHSLGQGVNKLLPTLSDAQQAAVWDINDYGWVVGERREFETFGSDFGLVWNLAEYSPTYNPPLLELAIAKTSTVRGLSQGNEPVAIGHGTFFGIGIFAFRLDVVNIDPDASEFPLSFLEALDSSDGFAASYSASISSDATYHVGAWDNQGIAPGSPCPFFCGASCGGVAASWTADSSGGQPIYTAASLDLADPNCSGTFHRTADVNTAGQIVGRSPLIVTTAFNPSYRATFWEDATASAVLLPNPPYMDATSPNNTRASAISDPLPDGRIFVTGSDDTERIALMWIRGASGDWEVYELDNLIANQMTGSYELITALDINSHGAIVGAARLTGPDIKFEPFILFPTDLCPGDISFSGVVNVFDLLILLDEWGACADPDVCVADLNGDGVVDVFDLLALLNQWGPCLNQPVDGPDRSLEQEILDAGLTMSDWDVFVDVMLNGTSGERNNYRCWMQRYLTGCQTCRPCSGANPFD